MIVISIRMQVYLMGTLLAKELLLLCWDDSKGCPSSVYNITLPVAIGGALLLDLTSTKTVIEKAKRLEPAGRQSEDKVLTDALTELVANGRRPTTHEAIRILGTTKWFERVHRQLVNSGELLRETCLFLRAFPVIRYRIVDLESANDIRRTVTALLTGQQRPQDVQRRKVMLAALIGAIEGVDVLVSRGEHKRARQRAATLAGDQSVYRAVVDVIREQMETMRMDAASAEMGCPVVAMASGSTRLS